MSQEKLFIPIILGTNREVRRSEVVARWIFEEIKKREDIETELFDVRDFKLPDDNYGEAIKDKFPEYRDAVTRCDGLIIVSPEYNHSYSGRLKSVLDILLREYAHKAVGLVGVSAGPWGGTRAIEQLIHVVRELGLAASFIDLRFPQVQTLFNTKGKPKEDVYFERLTHFIDELLWMSKTLRWGRENIPSRYRS